MIPFHVSIQVIKNRELTGKELKIIGTVLQKAVKLFGKYQINVPIKFICKEDES